MHPLPAVPELPARRAARPSWGEGFVLVCPGCLTPIRSGPEGRCPACGEVAVAATLAELEDRLPVRLRPVAAYLREWLAALAEWPLASPWSAAFALGALVGGPAGPWGWLLVPLAALSGAVIDRTFALGRPARLPPGVFLETARIPADPAKALPPGAVPRPATTGYRERGLRLVRSWWDLTRIRSRRGLAVHLEVAARGHQGRPLALELRLRGPDDRWLTASLPAYRGPDGEALASHRTAPLRHDDSHFADLWIFLPLRALALPAGLARAELTVELRLHPLGGEGLVHRLPVDFLPSPEDLLPPLPRAGDLSLELAPALPAARPACPVCGDDQGPLDRRCRSCEAAHHPECWDYLGGCGRFGCPSGPRQTPDAGA